MAVKLKKTVAINGKSYRLISKHSKKNLANKKEARLRDKGYNVTIIDRKATLGIYAIYARKRANSASSNGSSIKERVQSALHKAQRKRDITCRTSAGILASKSHLSKRRKFPPRSKKLKKYRGISRKHYSTAGGTLSGYCSPTARNPKGRRKRLTSYNMKKMSSRNRILASARRKASRNRKRR
jgi:hypothetical protein